MGRCPCGGGGGGGGGTQVRLVQTHLKDGVFTEVDEPLKLVLLTPSLHRVKEVTSRLLRYNN